MHPDDRVLVAIMNNRRDWALVENEGWYRVPVKHAPPGTPDFDWLAFYFTKVFKDDKWAIHYYAPIQGHELVTRRDLIPSQPKGFNMRRKTSAPNSSPDERCFVGSLI